MTNNDFPDMNSNPKDDAVLLGDLVVQRGDLFLYRKRPANRIGRTGELSQDAVACRVRDTAAMLINDARGDISICGE
jgi:hypothetical protein